MTAARPGLFSRVKIDTYLLLIITMVVLATIAPARGPTAHTLDALSKWAISVVFFMHGARLSRESVINGMTHWRLHLLVLGATYALFPLLCLGMAALPGWITPAALGPGLIFLGCLPSTIQSSVGFTVIARGNVPAAVASASGSNLVGILLTPLLVGVLLHEKGAVSLASAEAVFLQLLAPFLAGQVVHRWIGPWIIARGKVLQWVDRSSILLVVYTAFSSAVVGGVWSRIGGLDLVRLFVLCSILLAVVLVVTFQAGRALGFSTEDRIAILFCGSKKSLVSGVPMAGVLFPAAVAGTMLLPLMLFHQIQLMVCAVIAQRYANRPDSEAATG